MSQNEPSDFEQKMIQAIDYSENKEFEKSIQILDQLLDKEPDSITALVERGMAYHGLKDTENSSKDLLKAIELNPDIAITHYVLGVLYSETGQQDKAIPEFEDAINLCEDDDPLTIGESFFRMGHIFLNFDDLKRAVEFFEKAIQYIPDHLQANYNLAICLVDLGEMESALDIFEKVIQLAPDFTRAYFGRGYVYAILTDFESAYRDFDTYLKEESDDGEGWYYLGNCLWELGQKDEAHNVWKKAEALGMTEAAQKISDSPL